MSDEEELEKALIEVNKKEPLLVQEDYKLCFLCGKFRPEKYIQYISMEKEQTPVCVVCLNALYSQDEALEDSLEELKDRESP